MSYTEYYHVNCIGAIKGIRLYSLKTNAKPFSAANSEPNVSRLLDAGKLTKVFGGKV